MSSTASFDDASRGARTVIAELSYGSPWTRHLPSKLPEVTLLFWVATILASAAGVLSADYLSDDLGLGLTATTAIMSLLGAAMMMWQLSLRRYVPGVYWPAVVLVSAVGTMVHDDLVAGLELSAWATVALVSVALGLVLVGWYGHERTLSVHTVFTRRRESWYWSAVLGAVALGTSLGDLGPRSDGLGLARAGLIFAGALTVVALARYGLRLNAALGFWSAYVVIRPFSAAMGDLLTGPVTDSGLGRATQVVGALLLVVLIGGCTARARRSR